MSDKVKSRNISHPVSTYLFSKSFKVMFASEHVCRFSSLSFTGASKQTEVWGCTHAPRVRRAHVGGRFSHQTSYLCLAPFHLLGNVVVWSAVPSRQVSRKAWKRKKTVSFDERNNVFVCILQGSSQVVVFLHRDINRARTEPRSNQEERGTHQVPFEMIWWLFVSLSQTLTTKMAPCPGQVGVHLPEDLVVSPGGGPLSHSAVCQAVPGTLRNALRRFVWTSAQVGGAQIHDISFQSWIVHWCQLFLFHGIIWYSRKGSCLMPIPC